MWYLQGDTFLLIALFSLTVTILRRLFPLRIVNILLPVIEAGIIFFIDSRLAVFYIVYIHLGLLLAHVLFKRVKNSGHTARSKVLFALFSVVATIPLFLSRAEVFGIDLPFPAVSIGIAFQMLKMIDAFYFVYYAGEPVKALAYINYMLFLPVFTAGPIFRYRDFLKTYENPLVPGSALFADCFKRLVRGMFKKVVLVEIALLILEHLLKVESHWYLSMAVVVISYMLLYLDFSGYSDIAIAFGKVAGYGVPENFKKPLSAPTFSQFWRSWHATLSDWIREHIYVVVAKKRLSKAVSGLFAFSTMVIMSLWHGFNRLYLIAGVYNGLLLLFENLFSMTTVTRRKSRRSIYVLRCAAVNFMFGLNTLVFTVPPDKIVPILRGFLEF